MHFSITPNLKNKTKYFGEAKSNNNPPKNTQQSLINCLEKENYNPQHTYLKEHKKRNIGMVTNIINVTYHESHLNNS